MLRIGKDGIAIRDLGSSNGTLVNGERVVGERPLGAGDQLQVGPLVLQLVLEETVVDPIDIPHDETGEFCLDTAKMKGLASP